MTNSKQKSIQDRIENHADTIEEIVNDIIQPYCKDLDAFVDVIYGKLNNTTRPPTNSELENYCMRLAMYIYFAGGMCEQLGIRDDIGKAVYKEMYHTKRSEQEHGTVADKDSLAELASQSEQLISVCYTRAYKIMKAKVENAQELLSSCKKVLSHRMLEMELTRINR